MNIFGIDLQQTVNNFQNEITTLAENGRTNNEFAGEEEKFLKKFDAMRDDVYKQINLTRDAIISKRPNPDASNNGKNNAPNNGKRSIKRDALKRRIITCNIE